MVIKTKAYSMLESIENHVYFYNQLENEYIN